MSTSFSCFQKDNVYSKTCSIWLLEFKSKVTTPAVHSVIIHLSWKYIRGTVWRANENTLFCALYKVDHLIRSCLANTKYSLPRTILVDLFTAYIADRQNWQQKTSNTLEMFARNGRKNHVLFFLFFSFPSFHKILTIQLKFRPPMSWRLP